jgi:hypothetical protein
MQLATKHLQDAVMVPFSHIKYTLRNVYNDIIIIYISKEAIT